MKTFVKQSFCPGLTQVKPQTCIWHEHGRMSATITFLGGADTVTGSKYLIEHNQKRLLVECGLFQGYKQLRLRN